MMTIDALLTYSVQTAFILLGLLSVIDYLRFRGPIRRDIAFMFASLGITVALQLLNDLIGVTTPAFIGPLLLISQPYLLLRLVRYFRPVPLWLRAGAVISMVGAWTAVLVTGSELPPGLTLVIVLYFVLIDGYAMTRFIQGALQTEGVTQKRLRFTAAGSGLMALALALISLGVALPGLADTISLFTQLAALGSALAYYLGLAPPSWLRQMWQHSELYRFQLRITEHIVPISIPEIYDTLCRAARDATGAARATILLPPDGMNEGRQLYRAGKPDNKCIIDDGSVLIPQTATAVPTAALTPAERACLQPETADLMYIVPLERRGDHWGFLIVMLEYGSLFIDDDLKLLQLIAEQSTIILQNIDLAAELNEQADLLEVKIQQRTAELAQRNAHIQLLQAVTVAANEAKSINGPLQRAINLICQTVDLPLGHVYAPIEDAPTKLTSTSIWYLDDPEQYKPFREMTEATPFSPQLGGVGQVVVDGEPLWLTHLTQNPSFRRAESARAVGIQTGIFIPVFVNKEIAAVLEFFSSDDLPPDDGLLALLVNIGTQLGRVIERKKNERMVRRSEARFRALLESAPAGIVIINREGHMVMVNETAVDLFGYKQSEMVGQPLEMLLPEQLRSVHSRHRQAYFAQPRARPMGVGYDLVGRRKDGVEFPIEVGLSAIETEEGVLAVGFVTDISERKQIENELQRLNQELEQRVAERTAHLTAVNQELEAFSYSVSHDLRAPLRAIDGFSQALLEDYYAILDEEGQEFLQILRMESQHMGQLIDDLLALSRYTRADIHRQQVDMSAIARNIAENLQKRAPERQVAFVIEDGLVGHGDRRLIQVVLQNLLGNAWKYSAKQAETQIEFGCTAEKGEPVYFVRDNGIGFDMAYAHKLFGAFQRLHGRNEFEGTGIGLATVQRIIHRHGGTIKAKGTPHEGATFFFTLGKEYVNNE